MEKQYSVNYLSLLTRSVLIFLICLFVLTLLYYQGNIKDFYSSDNSKSVFINVFGLVILLMAFTFFIKNYIYNIINFYPVSTNRNIPSYRRQMFALGYTNFFGEILFINKELIFYSNHYKQNNIFLRALSLIQNKNEVNYYFKKEEIEEIHITNGSLIVNNIIIKVDNASIVKIILEKYKYL